MKATPPDPTPPTAETPPAPPPDAAPVPTPDPTATPEPAAAKPATWPEWFGAVDIALGAMTLIAAFLAASFVARNSDVWLHLAGGRLLAQGQYTPGADPFTFTGADRPWAHTSWLFDLAAYALYSADPTGAALVAVKAVLFAAAFGVLALLRKPGEALWPWAGVAVVGVLASALYSQARPSAVAPLFLATTLVLIYRGPWRADSWRMPAVLAGVFALWANLDGWAFLGPVVVGLVLLGERLNRFLARGDDVEAGDPFPPAPPAKPLLRALGLGVAACLLNPMVLAAAAKDPGEALAQLVPWEVSMGLIPSPDDPEMAGLFQRPEIDAAKFYFFAPGTADEAPRVNAFAFTLLLFGTALALAAGFARLRATHILLFVAFGILGLWHVRLAPLFAVVAVPLAAMYLNRLSRLFTLTTWADQSTRIILGASGIGRVVSVAALLAVIGSAYPGWIHPPVGDPALANRLDWAVEPEPGLLRSVQTLAKMRADGGLPADARGLATSVEFGNYCAWFTPAEKSFTTTRFLFHRADLPDLLAVRKAVAVRRGRAEDQSDPAEAARVCDDRGVAFLAVASGNRQVDIDGVMRLLSTDPGWAVWHLDGRAAVVGRAATRAKRQEYAKYRFDPARLAFGPGAEPLPVGKAVPPPPEVGEGWDGFVTAYLSRPAVNGPDADDAVVLARFLEYTNEVAYRRAVFAIQVGQVASGPAAAIVWLNTNPGPPPDDAQMGLPVLILRAARRAVANSPDRWQSFAVLVLALEQPNVPVQLSPDPIVAAFMNMSEHDLHLLTALTRYLARVPPPDKVDPTLAAQAYRASAQLYGLLYKTQQLDLARDVFARGLKYAKRLPPEGLWATTPMAARQALPPDKADEFVKAFMKQAEEQEDDLARNVQTQVDLVNRRGSLRERYYEALGRGLPGTALKLFRDTPDPNEFGSAKIDVVIAQINTELRAGQVERAAADLALLAEEIDVLLTKQPGAPQSQQFRQLQSVRARLEGDYSAVAEAQNKSAMPTLRPPIAGLGVVEALRAPGPVEQGGLTAVAGMLAMFQFGTPLDRAVAEWQFARQVLGGEVAYQFDRGLLAILDGNPAEARRRMDQALRPQGVDVSSMGTSPVKVRILRYSELLRKYEAAK